MDNGLAETTVIWTFTVTNVNEPPKFDPPSYETSIPEDITAAGTNPIIAVTAIDPDESTPDETFRIAKVTAECKSLFILMAHVYVYLLLVFGTAYGIMVLIT